MESETSIFIENVFGRHFTDQCIIEISGYNKELKLGFDFETSLIKHKICKKQKIKLLNIRSSLINKEERERYILDWLIRNSYSKYVIAYFKLQRIREQLLLCTVQDLKEIGEEMQINVTARYRDDIINQLCHGLQVRTK